ncbi:MAG: hypothetical protein KJN71_05370, partial [Acidimicrobiia bacterium]|nr:hypothetical protein [Acidimicrobiia bacterium]
MRSMSRREAQQPGTVIVDVGIDPESVSLQDTPFGLKVDIEGFALSGEIGGPGLPSKVLRVALPPGTDPAEVRWEIRDAQVLRRDPVLIAPLQPPRPGVDDNSQNGARDVIGGEPVEAGELRRTSNIIVDEPLVEPLPQMPFRSPIQAIYEREMEQSRPPVRLVATETIGLTTVAVVEVNPIVYEQDASIHLITSVDVLIDHRPSVAGPSTPERITSRAQAARLVEMAQMLVINPEDVWDITPLYPELITDVDYLVVTDDQRWNASTAIPEGAAGGLVAEFERLAEWKRRRGLRARVVTITDIVAGRYGSFASGSRDLQEVIRKFLRWAHDHWGVAWVLLGGDAAIVPIRKVPGAAEGHIEIGTSNPPDKNESFWTGTYLKMHVDRPGVWFPGTVAGLTLVNPHNGVKIPYDSTASAGLGWFFTTDDS